MKQQKNTFEVLYPHITENGIYVCEDLHTSYWKEYSGGYKKKGTFIEYSKNFIDYINAWHSRSKSRLKVNEFTKSTYALHYYDSMLVIEKKPMTPPASLESGTATITPDSFKKVSSSLFQRVKSKFRDRQ